VPLDEVSLQERGIPDTPAAEAFLANSGFLMNVLLRDLHEQDALDVFQNLYLNISSKGIPHNRENVRAYLYQAAQNDIIDFKRKSATYKKNIQHYSQAAKPKINDNPARKLMQFDLVMKAFDLISKHLGPSVNQVFIQKYKYNLNHYEIADKLKITKETVDRYLSVGTKQIQELSKYFLGDSDEKL
jgi:RNA polymerase sigma factor (sigma-70 family)